jgi:hypothetical protein
MAVLGNSSAIAGAPNLFVGANDADGEPAERRRHRRGIAVLKAAKLIWGRVEDLCLIRNISPAGLMADVYFPVTIGTKVLVMVTEDLPLSGTIIWVRGSSMGVQFDEEIDVEALVAGFGKSASGHRARMPRLDVDAWARLRVGARVFSVRLCDVSQGGARVRVEGLSSSGDDAVLAMDRFRPVHGVVRWRHGSQAGISFNQPLGLRELMQWLQDDAGRRVATISHVTA